MIYKWPESSDAPFTPEQWAKDISRMRPWNQGRVEATFKLLEKQAGELPDLRREVIDLKAANIEATAARIVAEAAREAAESRLSTVEEQRDRAFIEACCSTAASRRLQAERDMLESRIKALEALATSDNGAIKELCAALWKARNALRGFQADTELIKELGDVFTRYRQ